MEPTREQAYRRRIAALETEVAAMKAEVTRLAELVAKLSKPGWAGNARHAGLLQLTPNPSRVPSA